MVVKDEGVQDTAGTVYSLEDGRRDQEQQGPQDSLASFGQVNSFKSLKQLIGIFNKNKI